MIGLALAQIFFAGHVLAQTPAPAKAPSKPEAAQTNKEQAQTGLPLFYQKLELLDVKKHRALAVAKEHRDLGFASAANIIPIIATELALASKHYPLVFVPQANTPLPTLVAMVGLGDNKNIFVDAKGKWRSGVYVPAWVRRYPFLTVRGEENREALAFDPGSKLFTGKGNLPLFEKDQPTDTLKQIVAFQSEYNAGFQQTTAMVAALQEAGVLEAATFSIGGTDKDKPGRSISGFLVVNEAKLRALDSAAVYRLHQANALGLAYAQLLSMVNLQSFSPAK